MIPLLRRTVQAGSIPAAIRDNLLDCYKQEYCFGEIARAKGTGAFPPDGDRLLGQLRNILSENQQISELENETAEVTAFGGTLLLFYYLDSHTLLELVEQPNGAGYDSFVLFPPKSMGTICTRPLNK